MRLGHGICLWGYVNNNSGITLEQHCFDHGVLWQHEHAKIDVPKTDAAESHTSMKSSNKFSYNNENKRMFDWMYEE